MCLISRYDPFAEGSQTPDIRSERRTTSAVMSEIQVRNEKMEMEQKIREKAKAGELKAVPGQNGSSTAPSATEKKKRRWDQTGATEASGGNENSGDVKWHEAITPRNLPASTKDMETPMNRIWDATPGHAESSALTPPDIGMKYFSVYIFLVFSDFSSRVL